MRTVARDGQEALAFAQSLPLGGCPCSRSKRRAASMSRARDQSVRAGESPAAATPAVTEPKRLRTMAAEGHPGVEAFSSSSSFVGLRASSLAIRRRASRTSSPVHGAL